MAACCGLLNCFGASASRKPLRDMHEQDGEVVEVLPPFWNNYPHSANLTTETVRANLYALNLMDKPKLISCCLMLHKLSSQNGVDIDSEFANQHISGYHVTAEGSSTEISLIYNNQIVECSCLHLDGFQEMKKNLMISVGNVENKVDDLENFFLTSLSDCRSHSTTGGKSQSTFMQSEDGFFIIKEIEEKEYISFKMFGDRLLDHIATGQTCLNIPWGVYKVVANGVASHYLVTNKLRIPGASLILFDLKGIQGRHTQDRTSTLLDDDFVKEMQNSGFLLNQNELNTLIQRVERDTNFLQMVNVMDYSLLVGWDKRKKIIVYGIIDYLVQFDYLKKLEYTSNTLRWKLYLRSLPPTVIPPLAYANRLSGFVRANFRAIRATNEGNVNQSGAGAGNQMINDA